MEPLEITYGVSRYANTEGVTCYMNSILTILQQTPIFIDYILNAEFNEKLLKHADIKKSILFQFHNIMTISNTHDNLIINPTTFRNTLALKNEMWGMHMQQDSQEFLTFLLNSIEEEICDEIIFIPGNNLSINQLSINDNLIKLQANSMWQKFIKKEFSIIKNLFCGMTHETITCNFCNNKVHNFDMFQILQLSIHKPEIMNTLYDCLDKFINTETFDKDNMYKCDFCGRKNKATKNTTIWNSPPILIIQLKRFESNSWKLTNMIDYPLELDLTKYIDKLGNPCKYKLFAINNHISNNTRFGHYTSIVKNRLDDTWYEFDDSNVLHKVEEIDLINKNAYMLFYYKS